MSISKLNFNVRIYSIYSLAKAPLRKNIISLSGKSIFSAHRYELQKYCE